MSSRTLVILALEQALPSALIGIADMLALASISQQHSPNKMDQAPDRGSSEPEPLNFVTASTDGRSIHDGQGRAFKPDCGLNDIDSCSGVLIPGFVPDRNGLPPEPLVTKDCHQWLNHQYNQGVLLGGSCSGVFVLGEAGLLKHKRCTTTWWLHYEFTRRYPLASAAWGSALIQDHNIITAGGPMSWVDISLRMIRSFAGANAANRTADFAVVDAVPSGQDRYIPQGHMNSVDPFLIEAEDMIRRNISKAFSTVELASTLAVSERTLHRRLKQLTGEAPKSFMNRVRMDIAKTILLTTNQKIKSIALEFGYTDETVFRRLFRKQVGMSPSGYRRWKSERDA